MSRQLHAAHVRTCPPPFGRFPRLLGHVVDANGANGANAEIKKVSSKSNAEWIHPSMCSLGGYGTAFDDERATCSTGTASSESLVAANDLEEIPSPLFPNYVNQAHYDPVPSLPFPQYPGLLPLPPGLWERQASGADTIERERCSTHQSPWDAMEPVKIEFAPGAQTLVLSHDVALVERQTRSIRAQRPLDVAKSVPREDNSGVQTVMSGVGASKNPLPVTSHQGIDGSLGFRQAESTRHRPTALPPFDEIPRVQGTCELGTLAATGHVNSRSGRARRRCHRFTCKFVFAGFDLEEDADFELVPRLIGRGGAHMRAVAEACQGKVRIRGRGSGYMEQQKGGRPPAEAGVPLQIVVSCTERFHLEEGKRRLQALLQNLSLHFDRYRKMRGAEPPLALYSITDDTC